MLVVPAYSRDYRSKKEIEKDLLADKDFKINDISSPDDGRYINLSQMKEAGIKEVRVRYKKLTMSCMISIAKLKPSIGEPSKPAPETMPPSERSPQAQAFVDVLERSEATGGVRNPPESISQPFGRHSWEKVILECRVDGKLCFDKPQPPTESMPFDDVYKLYWKENPSGSGGWNELRAWLESKSWTVRACTWE